MGRLTPQTFKERQAAIWGSGPFERIAATLAPMHDDLVSRLRPTAGERWLDVGSGTGAVAERLARAEAEVTGIDLAPALIKTAKHRAHEQRLMIAYEVGDAEQLPYLNASFDGVASAVGLVFAPDQRRVARELARVCRPGGKLGVTAWRRKGGVGDFFELMRPFDQLPGPGAPTHFDWGEETSVLELLGDSFELEFVDGDAPFRAPSADAAWEELSSAYGPTRVLAESLDPRHRKELARAIVGFYEQFQAGDGVCHSRQYLLSRGIRR